MYFELDVTVWHICQRVGQEERLENEEKIFEECPGDIGTLRILNYALETPFPAFQ